MNQRPGKFLERLFAVYLDMIVVSIAIVVPILLMVLIGGEGAAPTIVVYAISIFFLSAPLGALYQTYFTTKLGGTLGKLLLGLRIENRDSSEFIDRSRAFYRATLGYIFSAQLFGLGFWRIIKNEENLAWHDDLFFTKVVKFRSGLAGYILLALTLVIPILLFILAIMLA